MVTACRASGIATMDSGSARARRPVAAQWSDAREPRLVAAGKSSPGSSSDLVAVGATPIVQLGGSLAGKLCANSSSMVRSRLRRTVSASAGSARSGFGGTLATGLGSGIGTRMAHPRQQLEPTPWHGRWKDAVATPDRLPAEQPLIFFAAAASRAGSPAGRARSSAAAPAHPS